MYQKKNTFHKTTCTEFNSSIEISGIHNSNCTSKIAVIRVQRKWSPPVGEYNKDFESDEKGYWNRGPEKPKYSSSPYYTSFGMDFPTGQRGRQAICCRWIKAGLWYNLG